MCFCIGEKESKQIAGGLRPRLEMRSQRALPSASRLAATVAGALEINEAFPRMLSLDGTLAVCI